MASVSFEELGPINLMEGQTAHACIDINDTSLLNLTHPPTVVVATVAEFGNGPLYF